MIITHAIHNATSKDKDAAFLLVNKKGSFFSLGRKNISHFQGLHELFPKGEEWSFYKCIENISIDDEPRELVNHLAFAERKGLTSRETFYFLSHGLVYDIQNYTGSCYIDLDCREIYDAPELGRIYEITEEQGVLFIAYKQYADNALKQLQKTFHIGIKGIERYAKPNAWFPQHYSYDQLRETRSTFWVYRALNIYIPGNAHILMAFAPTKKEAYDNLKHLEEHKSHLIHTDATHARHFLKQLPHAEKEIRAAYACACYSLENLIQKIHTENSSTLGLYAGLPWFFHFWTRDELISLKALMLLEKYALVKLILFKHLNNIKEDGRIPNRVPVAKLGDADGIGWLFKRIGDLITILEQKRLLKDYFSANELQHIASQLEYAIARMQTIYLHDALIWNNPKETWMDTDYKYDSRSGKRIEIQALYLNMLNLMSTLGTYTKSDTNKYKTFEEQTTQKVRELFFKDGFLQDGSEDATIRPNIFLAYYIYPALLSKKEWALVFQNSIPKLWLEWGGLASIDKNSSLFFPYYTGQNNQSYHRGDSWFFLNNIAALALKEVDEKQFALYIKKLLDASVQDTLFFGFIGHASEISSANAFQPAGCFCQAWSNATLIELIRAHAP